MMAKVTRRTVVALLTGLAFAPVVFAQGPPATRARPNIVWISNEDMSPHLGAYGDSLARTPNLDRLAKASVRFTNAFTTAPVCAPSRAAIITGMHQNAIGAQHMRTTEDRVPELPGPYLAVPPFYVKAFPEYLRAAGYFTSNRSKTDYQFGVPFTIWDDLGPKAHWRNRPDKSQPFFAVFNFMVTHESQAFPSSPERKGKPLVTNPAKITVPPYYPDTPLVREELARMYDNIADMDAQAGEILRQLDEDGLAGNTIVFYWSDHGDGVPRAKRSLYDSGLHVPLMIRWPAGLSGGPSPGSVNDQLVSFVDLAPTVLALAGAEVPAHLQGRILVGPKAGAEPEFVFAARDRMDIEYDMMRSARDRRFLYIRNVEPELPYVGHIIYRNQSSIMQEWFRLQAERKLAGPPALWMRRRRRPSISAETSTSRRPGRRNDGTSASTREMRLPPSRMRAISGSDFTERCWRSVAPASSSAMPGTFVRQKSRVAWGTASNAAAILPRAGSARASSCDRGKGRTSSIAASARARARLLRTRRTGAPEAGTNSTAFWRVPAR